MQIIEFIISCRRVHLEKRYITNREWSIARNKCSRSLSTNRLPLRI